MRIATGDRGNASHILAMTLHDELAFASDAEIATIAGGAFVVLALVCLIMERRRMGAAAIDRVGWMPWTGLFLTCAVFAGGLLALGVPAMLRG